MKNSRLLTVQGDDYTRGQQIGKAIGYSIKVNFANQVRHYKEAMDYDFHEWVKKCETYVDLIREYTPHTYDELRGMADGAGIPFSHVLALTSAYELAVAGGNVADKCTGFFAAGIYTADGSTICGQTNDEDFGEWIPYLDVVLRHKNSDGPSALVYTHPGIAAYMGMNDRGLSILWQYIDNGERKMGVPTNCIIREVLFYEGLDDAVAFLKKIPHTIPNHYLVSDRDKGVASMECYPEGVYIRNSKTNICHANNILTESKMAGCDKLNPLHYRKPFSAAEMEREAYEGDLVGTKGVLEWSYVRYDTICRLVEANKGRIDVDRAKEFLATTPMNRFRSVPTPTLSTRAGRRSRRSSSTSPTLVCTLPSAPPARKSFTNSGLTISPFHTAETKPASIARKELSWKELRRQTTGS